jgi:WD40 repeat protein
VRFWDEATGESLAKLDGHRRSVESIVIDSEGRWMYSASSDSTIRKIDLRTGECERVMKSHETSVFSLLLSTDDESLWSGMFHTLLSLIIY